MREVTSRWNSSVANCPVARNGRLIGAAGFVVLLISVGAALIPVVELDTVAGLVGAMMVAAGSAETLVGALRGSNKGASLLPGIATMLAGALFLSGQFDNFLASVQLMIGWLALRSVVLLLAGFEGRRSVRVWTFVSAGTDLGLGSILLAGLSASTFPVAIFGASSDVVRGFAVIVAISFVTTAMLLIEIAAAEFEAS